MNRLKIVMCGCMISMLLSFQGYTLAGTLADAKSDGTISFYFRDGTPQCSFPVISRVESFVETPRDGTGFPCKLLSGGGYFELNNVPSATKIWLINGKSKRGQLPSGPKECGLEAISSHDWYELLTIKNPTTTQTKINILDLKTLPPKEVVQPGLRFIQRRIHSSGPNEINCVFIDVSP